MDLGDFLTRAGYRRVPLSRSGVGHFHTAATLAGRPVSALVDTGAEATVVSLALAREMGLPLIKSDGPGAGAGGTRIEVHRLDHADLRLDDLTAQVDLLLAMDLSHVNEALAQRGESAIEVIIGGNVLTAHQAVIDYPSNSLYLRP